MSFRDRLRPGIPGLEALRLFDYPSRPGLIRMDSNELPFPPSDAELDELRAALGDIALHRYPDVSGEPLRRALAERWGVSADEILLGNGSIEVLGLVAAAFGVPGAKLAFPDPSFPYYEVLARTNGLEPLSVPLGADFRLDEARFAAAIESCRPAVCIVSSPNNPTGNAFDAGALDRLAAQAHGAFVVDEAYADFRVPKVTLMQRAREQPGLFVSRSFSKIGFAGLRVGALVGAREAIAELDKVRLPWNLDAVACAFARIVLGHSAELDARVAALLALRESFVSGLSELPSVTVYPSESNFVLVRTPLPGRLLFERLLSRGVLVKDVSRPGPLERCVRITVGTESETARCLEALRASLESDVAPLSA